MKVFPAVFQVLAALLCFSEIAGGESVDEPVDENNGVPMVSVAESYGQLSSSGLAYAFSEVIELLRDEELENFTIPDEFPEKNMTRFLHNTSNYMEFNDGNGISFYELCQFVEQNEEALVEKYLEGEIHAMGGRVYEDLQVIKEYGGEDGLKGVFLSSHRSHQQDVALVYSVIKDTITKRIIVSFRGSMSMKTLFFGGSRDWKVNIRPGTQKIKTLEKIRTKYNLREHVSVRKGFYNYLFDNDKMKALQRYDNIKQDIQTLLKGETGYSVIVTGHSLGGALAALFSFSLASGDEKDDMLGTEHVPIPQPVTCITWAAPFTGSNDFRIAYEALEREGLLRSLRITNKEDPVPTLLPVSFGARNAHAGIHIRLTSSGYTIEHSSRAGFWTAIRNTPVKPYWQFLNEHTPHSLTLHRQRFLKHVEDFALFKIDDLYKNNTVVSQDFIDGNIR